MREIGGTRATPHIFWLTFYIWHCVETFITEVHFKEFLRMLKHCESSRGVKLTFLFDIFEMENILPTV